MTVIPDFKGYSLNFTNRALKDLEKIDNQNKNQIRQKLDLLINGNQNIDIKKVSGEKFPTYRLRFGNYRVIFEANKKEILINANSIINLSYD